jgi:hypothetical protein
VELARALALPIPTLIQASLTAGNPVAANEVLTDEAILALADALGREITIAPAGKPPRDPD